MVGGFYYLEVEKMPGIQREDVYVGEGSVLIGYNNGARMNIKDSIVRHCPIPQPPPLPEPLVWPDEPVTMKALYKGKPAWIIHFGDNADFTHTVMWTDDNGRLDRFIDRRLPDDCEIIDE